MKQEEGQKEACKLTETKNRQLHVNTQYPIKGGIFNHKK